MRAVRWHGKHDVRVDTVADPEIVNPRDAIIKVTSTAICGSDLHLYDGVIPTMQAGDILGHEFMGEVVDVGSAHKGNAQRARPEGRPARHHPVHHRLRFVLLLRKAALVVLRQLEPRRHAGHRRYADGPLAVGAVRL